MLLDFHSAAHVIHHLSRSPLPAHSLLLLSVVVADSRLHLSAVCDNLCCGLLRPVEAEEGSGESFDV